MGIPDHNIYTQVLVSARKEFLEKGYTKASLREICKKAGVTTGALYKRFPNKESLFMALVEPVIRDVYLLEKRVEEHDYARLEKGNAREIWEASTETIKDYANFIYDRYEGFRLLLCKAEGSPCNNFMHDFVTRHTKVTLKFLKVVQEKGMNVKLINEMELHMLLTAFYATLFEPLLHGLSREDALRHCEYVAQLFNWRVIFGF